MSLRSDVLTALEMLEILSESSAALADAYLEFEAAIGAEADRFGLEAREVALRLEAGREVPGVTDHPQFDTYAEIFVTAHLGPQTNRLARAA